MNRELFQQLKRLRRVYEDSNKGLEKTMKLLNSELPPRYYMNEGCIEFIDYLLSLYE